MGFVTVCATVALLSLHRREDVKGPTMCPSCKGPCSILPVCLWGGASKFPQSTGVFLERARWEG